MPGRSASLGSPRDIKPWDAAPAVTGSTYRAEARSVVMLFLPDRAGYHAP